jgi:TctA family transporter
MNVEARRPAAGPQDDHAPSGALTRVLNRMPETVCSGLTPTQLAALDSALDANNPTRHAINLRLTLFGLAYLVILGGREQRSGARRTMEREKHPLHTPGNVAALIVIALLGLALGYALRTLVFGG